MKVFSSHAIFTDCLPVVHGLDMTSGGFFFINSLEKLYRYSCAYVGMSVYQCREYNFRNF